MGRLIVISKDNNKLITDLGAYWPITLILNLRKILERTFLKCATDITNSLSQCQHEFSIEKFTHTVLESILGVARDSTSKYVQAIFLDIFGAFDNAWWPKRGRCPPNLYKMLNNYFADRKVRMYIRNRLSWKRCTMSYPQGFVLRLSLWIVL
ncbi:RNA-directed DNA polymerase from mobile element jockey [Eumeta japonica]|uniref:RNA-directed DNA polymerase from mobile element jockey n=1 Tax=Eumeta variegata TaxID=151549 RepID=A0A4C2A2L5_EUMVA|nr:RNA-directed DNA polymerase from mobile element jockey [Eumeta japonica]